MMDGKWDDILTVGQREKLLADLKKAAKTDPAELARQFDLVNALMSQERELIAGVEELLTTARFLTLEPFAAYTRIAGTEEYKAFMDSYKRIESWFDLAVTTRARLAQSGGDEEIDP
jgi:hypothetical protein